ncbi:GH92 family glycosyl hydrolase [Actinoplanes sp. LDG1-06]|uniref:GH92 family glycosyl hydrolase n=1 Tax=Paractinoplanes ovalisporus TaxID=2810368 RepID=A0ABS2AHA2_9ACTN|nr:GH92 family glycosyl hydrolase [Actinoplanes ovalisporus]MBM2618589.1 GH92 family glycosyl hydrolase [Actinoplanes ovalisporus]
MRTLTAPRDAARVEHTLSGTPVGQTIGPGDELSWLVRPEGTEDVATRWDATAVTVDVRLDDGSRLSGLGLHDQYGGGLSPEAQRDERRLWPDQWNLRRVAIGEVAAGRRIEQVQVVLLGSAQRAVTVQVDSVRLTPRTRRDDVLDQVLTTRGTNSTRAFSRGNTAPLVGVPHGSVFGLPMTDAAAVDWPYTYASTSLAAFATSHISSPWMRDYGQFQLMPSASADPDPTREGRALAFDRADESAGPHRYAVRLAGGIEAELTAGDAAIALRVTGAASLILDHSGQLAAAHESAEGATWTLDVTFAAVGEKPENHVHVRVPAAGRSSVRLHEGRLTGHVGVAGPGPVEAIVGYSAISPEQARSNAVAGGGFDRMLADAERRWREVVGTVELEGATEDQRVSVMSGLYRAFLYPTRYDETTAPGVVQARSPYDGALVDGPFSASNGFWDTYRTAWPLLTLLDPASAARHADGFLAHGEWTPRWSAPAAEDCMTGTTFDLVFADLVAKEMDGLDLERGYAAARKNATVPSPDPRVGRKGLIPAIFRGYVSTDTPEGLSWTLDNALNDAGIALLARKLAEQCDDPDLRAEAEYFARRALGYREVFDRDRGFFIGRDANGRWRDGFDPLEWGRDYTETTAWGTAFTVPHDGAGLAQLHGGEAALGRALDAMRQIPETAEDRLRGHYPEVIHEMREARDVRSGMLALSNQPAHHIPFMYMFAGRHDDAHAVVADARRRLFAGSDFGQGYPGDEDNGEMSAWYVFTTIGLYPLVPASGSYVLVPPAVARTRIAPRGGRPIELRVRSGRPGDPYIRAVHVDGEPWDSVVIDHARLVRGCTVEFDLSPEPTGWAAASRPPSVAAREPLRDACRPDGPLTDDLGSRAVPLAAGDQVEVAFDAAAEISLLTITVATPLTLDATVELLDGRGQATASRTLHGERFDWPGQTRVFATPHGAAASGLRLTAHGAAALTQLQAFPAEPS